jgi:Lon protease-like protein
MFPLGMTLLPGAVIPLRVFEPRYRQMIRDILADDINPAEFGVTMIERGREVGGGDERASIGTVARIIDLDATTDGGYVLVAAGTVRLKVNAWLPDDPYPVADVDPWPDDDGGVVSADVVDELHARVDALNDLVRRFGEFSPPPSQEIGDDPQLAVYRLASMCPFGAADLHRILAARSLADRVDVLTDAIDDSTATWQFRLS